MLFKVIKLAPGNAEDPVVTSALVSDRRIDIQMAAVRRGVPRTSGEWTALVKIASGETDVCEASRARLFELGLIEDCAGLCNLTRHGRLTLGLAD